MCVCVHVCVCVCLYVCRDCVVVSFGFLGVVARDCPRVTCWLIGCARDWYVSFCVRDFGCADSVSSVLLVAICVRVCRVVGLCGMGRWWVVGWVGVWV